MQGRRGTVWLLALSILLGFDAGRVVADLVPGGAEFQVNTYTTSAQLWASVCGRLRGGFVVVWQGFEQDGYFGGVFGQRFAADGAPAGTEFQVNSRTTGDEGFPAVCYAPTGDFVVIWEGLYHDGDGEGVFGQRFGADGAPAGTEFQVNSLTTRNQDKPSVACGDDGSFVVVWEGFVAGPGIGGGRDRIFGQRYASDGMSFGSEFQVNVATDAPTRSPAIAMSAGGGFVVVWTSYYDHDGDAAGILARSFDAAGDAFGDEFQVNTYASGGQYLPGVASAADGSFVVVWLSNQYFYGIAQDGSHSGVFGQRFTDHGERLGGEFQVNTTTLDHQTRPEVAVYPNGDFVVVWENLAVLGPSPDGSGAGIFGQRFDSSVVRIGTEFQINTYTTGHQVGASGIARADGSFVVVWSSDDQDGSNYGVFGQVYEGTAIGTVCGDAISDATISATDALRTLRTSIGLSNCPVCICDVNADGTITTTDALAILLVAVGLPVELTCVAC